MPAIALHNERALMEQVALGDEAAFTQLYYAYQNRLALYLFRITSSLSVTQELVQDVFLNIWLHRVKLAGMEKFDAYLFTAARNHAFNYLKRLARERNQQQAWTDHAAVESEIATEPASLSATFGALIDQAIERLPPQQQKVYSLHRYEGLSHAEIAEQLGLATETVKKHMVLALRSIREYVGEHRHDADVILLIMTGFTLLS